MPSLAAAYFAVYIAFSLWALIDDIKERVKRVWEMTFEAVCDVLLIAAALSFWQSPSGLILEWLLPIAFSVGTAGTAFLMMKALRKEALDPELPASGQLFVAVSGSLLAVALVGPLVYWGFHATFLHRFAAG